jgi:hypothetical protein
MLSLIMAFIFLALAGPGLRQGFGQARRSAFGAKAAHPHSRRSAPLLHVAGFAVFPFALAGFAVFVFLFAAATVASAQTADERAAARQVTTRHGAAIVTLLGTATVNMSVAGQPAPPQTQAIQAVATILDPTGLAVLSLSAVEPTQMFDQMASAAVAMGRPKPAMTVSLTDLRMRLANGTELPVRIVLRDRLLDLTFVRPAAPPADPLTSISEAAIAQPQILDPVVSLRRFGDVLGWPLGVSVGYVRAVGEKSRTVYVISSASGDNALGEPVFDLSGRFVGVVTMRTTGDVSSGPESLLQAVVVTAADVRDLARRAK